MRRPATLNEIRRALFRTMQEAVAEDEDDGRVYVVPPAQEGEPGLKMLLLLSSFTPGQVNRAELGGYGALAERVGIWKMTISALKDNDAGEPWRLAEKLEQAFLPYTVDALEVVPPDDDGEDVCAVYCSFPYTENVGVLPDGRNGISVTVPWWTWTQN